MRIIWVLIKHEREDNAEEELCAFLPGRSSIDNVFGLKILLNKNGTNQPNNKFNIYSSTKTRALRNNYTFSKYYII